MKRKILRIAGSVVVIATASLLIHLSLVSKFTDIAQPGNAFRPTGFLEKPVEASASELMEDPKAIIGLDAFDESSNRKIYDGYLDLPLLDMRYADDDIFAFLKNSYNNVNFYGEFRKGNLDQYNYYLEKYHLLLNNEASFIDQETGEDLCLNELEYMKTRADGTPALDDCIYYFFDINEDGAPELCINSGGFIYVFKYFTDRDSYVLWRDLCANWYFILGSKKVVRHSYGIGSRYMFYQLDEIGETVLDLFFLCEENFNRKTAQEETVFVIALPIYTNSNEQIKMSKKIEQQAYCFRGHNRIVNCFRVTEEQYNELTGDYFRASELAEEKIKEVTFTYDELFG